MSTLLITRGLPGSGKTTAAQAWRDEDAATRARVNRDDVRVMLHGRRLGTNAQEEQVSALTHRAIRDLLRMGMDVVCDDTNLSPRSINQLCRLATQAGADFRIWDFIDVPIEVCIERDAQRSGNAHVGERVIRDMWRRYLAPKGAA